MDPARQLHSGETGQLDIQKEQVKGSAVLDLIEQVLAACVGRDDRKNLLHGETLPRLFFNFI